MAQQTLQKTALRISTFMTEKLVGQYNKAQTGTTKHKSPYYSKYSVAQIRKTRLQLTRCLTNSNLLQGMFTVYTLPDKSESLASSCRL